MNICTISDTHSRHREIEIPECDILIHAGDFTYFSKGGESEILDFLSWLNAQPAKHKVFIAGNHEILWERKEQYFKNKIPDGIHYLNDSSVTIEGIKIWGSPITPTFYNWAYNRNRGDDIKKHWDLIPDDIDILVTHGPAFGILDDSIDGHVGCEELLKKIEKNPPSINIFGHIHLGGKTIRNINNKEVKFYNSALVNGKYKIKRKPHFFEFKK
jgi:Icc-related predicted phosphoesterase